MWGLSTICLICVPFFLSVINHLVQMPDLRLRNLYKTYKSSLIHLPTCQPFNHLIFWMKLKAATKILDYATKDLREAEMPIDTMNEEERYKAEENNKRLEWVERLAKKSVAQVQGEFHQTKIFEAYGESAPQFCLQLAIVLQVGYISPLQIISVTISFLSFTLAASAVYCEMPTKYSEITHQDWKNQLYIVPAMFFSLCPRLLSLSLFMAYIRTYTFIAIGLALLVEFALLRNYLQVDRGNSLMGMFTSWFVPCIVKDHYTKFFLKTSITTTAIYIVAISLLLALVKMEWIVPAIQSFPPIIHCFKVTNWNTTASQSRCYYNGIITQICTSTLITTSNDFPGFVPVCQAGEEKWHRLGWICLVLVIFLLISLASGYFLHWYLDPINRLKATSWWCLGQVWDPEQEDIKDAVVKLVVNRGQCSEFETLNADCMQKHNGKKTLLYRAVEEGHIQFVDVLLRNCNAFQLDSDENSYKDYHPLIAALEIDRPKVVLKLVIDSIKGNRIIQLSESLNTVPAELFGPGHIVGLGLGLRLKSEIRTRTRART
jgi:hypothetical protein